MKKYLSFVLVSGLATFGVGCGDSGGGGTGGTGGSGCTVSGDLCTSDGTEITLPTELCADVTLSAGCTYKVAQTTYVTGGTTTIEAGTTIVGDNAAGFVVTQNGKIDAVGTAASPIVFTSSKPEGDRAPADWGGVVLLGKAKLSWGNGTCDGMAGECVANIEGLEPTEERGLYGGNDDTHDCGTIRYARIEFAGFVFGDDNELNGLSVGGCGSQTELSYIQIHRGEDDGVEFFGGTASIDHLVVSGPGDDGLDWDQGWQGSAENFIVHHFDPRSEDPRGIEADNSKNSPTAEPRSQPTVSCGTIIGDGSSGDSDRGIVLRRGTLGNLSQLIVSDFAKAGIDIRDEDGADRNDDPPGVDAIEDWNDGDLIVEDSYFRDNDEPYADESLVCDPEVDDPCDNNDEGFDEPTLFAAGLRGNVTNTDPDYEDIGGALDGSSHPDYRANNITDAGAFCDDAGQTDWTLTWTAYPEN